MKSQLLAERKGDDVMSAMKGIMRRAILSGVVGTAIVAAVGVARADVASDQPGAILIYPKIVVDSSAVFGPPTDTEIQITNTSNSVIAARCFLVDTTSHCSNDPTQACTAVSEADPNTANHKCPLGGSCVPGWQENDFRMTLTKRQPVSWKASEGLNPFPLGDNPPSGSPGFGPGGQSNGSSAAPGVQEDPFFGELKCVEVDPTTFSPTQGFNPANNAGGDLKGEATIVSADPETDDSNSNLEPLSAVDSRKYNAIGIQAIAGANDGDDTLTLGGPGAEYNGCPNILILNTLFDDAVVSTFSNSVTSRVKTDLTVVPCSEDFSVQQNNLGGATLQFLVYNEFEQRFSTSTKFTCWKEVQLSDIDTRPGDFTDDNDFSIFNANVEGTFSGQVRIRAVAGQTQANGVLGLAEHFFNNSTNGPAGRFSSANNMQFTGTRSLSDQLILSPE
jgi:hypothetical protein